MRRRLCFRSYTEPVSSKEWKITLRCFFFRLKLHEKKNTFTEIRLGPMIPMRNSIQYSSLWIGVVNESENTLDTMSTHKDQLCHRKQNGNKKQHVLSCLQLNLGFNCDTAFLHGQQKKKAVWLWNVVLKTFIFVPLRWKTTSYAKSN